MALAQVIARLKLFRGCGKKEIPASAQLKARVIEGFK